MFIRNIYIYIIIIVSSIFAQSFFNRFVGEDIQFGDARSVSLANSNVTTGMSSLVTSKNPARLAYLANGKKGVLFNYQLNSGMFFERRSFPYYDNFDEFLGYTDYVHNRDNKSYNAFGFIIGNKINDNSKIGFGASMMPLASFNYVYEEEVRGEKSFEDGIIGIKDPLLGFHIYSNSGQIDVFSFGFGFSYSSTITSAPFSFGFSINHILESEISDYIAVETLLFTEDMTALTNLSNIEPINSINKTSSARYETISMEIPLSAYSSKSSIILAYENNAMIKSKKNNNSYLSNIEEILSSVSGLPSVLIETHGIYTWAHAFDVLGVDYFKPRKITLGLRLDRNRTLLIIENSTEYYNEFSHNFFNDVSEFKIGFEYRFRIGPPIRMGLSYTEPLLNRFGPITKVTFGSKKEFFKKKLNIGFALQYYLMDYLYEDIFPVDSFSDDCSVSCEKVTESNIRLITTLQWSF